MGRPSKNKDPVSSANRVQGSNNNNNLGGHQQSKRDSKDKWTDFNLIYNQPSILADAESEDMEGDHTTPFYRRDMGIQSLVPLGGPGTSPTRIPRDDCVSLLL